MHIAIVLLLFVCLSGTWQTTAQPQSKLLFAALGDNGTGKEGQLAIARALEKQHDREAFDLVLLLGDNIYGGGKNALFERFELPYQNLLKRGVKFQAALGNHDGGKADAEINYDKFNMGGRRYYTFTRGERFVQFFALDSTDMSTEQLTWLGKELAASRAQWKIAFFHHPMYSSGRTHGSDKKLRKKLEPLFVQHGVNVVLSGHDHFYERIKPQQGIQYFVSGAGGQLRPGNIKRNDDLFAAGNDQTHHFMLLEATNSELRFRAIGPDGAVLDSGAIPARKSTNQQ